MLLCHARMSVWKVETGGNRTRGPCQPHLEERDEERVDPDEEAPRGRLVPVAVDERDGQHDLVRDVGQPGEHRRAEEDQEAPVGEDHGERAALRRSFGRELTAVRQVPVRDEPRDARQHRNEGEERRPRPEHEHEAAERRPDHHAHVRGHAHGGVRVLAALRGGITTVMIPADNVKDLREIPDNVKNGLELIPVSNVMDVLRTALVRMPEPIEWDETAEAAKAPAVQPPAGEGPSAPAH